MELLVVIAVIAILASMLFPALRTARGVALSSACIGNQRQIYLGFQGFAMDHDSRLPPTFHHYLNPDLTGGRYVEEFGLEATSDSSYPGGWKGRSGYWNQAIGPYFGHPEWSDGWHESSEQAAIKRRARDSVVNCPAQRPTEADFDRFTYGKSSRLGPAASKDSTSTSNSLKLGDYPKIQTIRYPEIALLVSDTNRTSGLMHNPPTVANHYEDMLAAVRTPGTGSGGYRSSQWLRHNLGANVLFVAGHVRHVKAMTLFSDLTPRAAPQGALRLVE